MAFLNVEFKARINDSDKIRDYLHAKNARFIGLDHQTDTYFHSRMGRLKLREGNVENHLIHYLREDLSGPKSSLVSLYPTDPNSPLKELLTRALGIKVVVDKEREIYFIDHIKFHLDQVKGLGRFVEVEAIDLDGSIGAEKLRNQCLFYLEEWGIGQDDLISVSYSDLLIQKMENG